MKIRPVKSDDRAEWVRMRAELYSNPDPKEVDDWLGNQDANGTPQVGLAVLVADRGDGSLAGFAEIGSRNYAEGCESTPVAYLEGWYVDPDVRQSGIGAQMLTEVETWALENGFSELASDAELDNSVSQKAHLALGFEEVERHICFRKPLNDR